MALARLLDRETEIAALQGAHARALGGLPQLAIVWGRRRVGKTFLLLHLLQRVEGARTVFHAATQQSEAVELERFAESLRAHLGEDALDLAGGAFSSWERALRFVVALGREEPLVLVLDEVPYLTRSTPGFASIVQAVWDRETGASRPSRLLLALTGSAVGTMEDVLGPEGALHRRATLELRVDPVDLPSTATFLPSLDAPGLIEAYAACGGFPLHLAAWDESASTRENLLALAGSPGGVLLEDAPATLREELGDATGYTRVLAAVGRGRTRYGEIRTEADQRIERPLDVLVASRLLRRSTPLGAPRRAAPLYELADPYLRFWFSVLYPDVALLEGGQGRAVLQRNETRWQQHLGWVFEEAARAHARRLVDSGVLPEDLVTGRWWSTSGAATELDVLGLRGTRTALLGEVRWRAAPLGLREAADLRRRGERAPAPMPDGDPQLALWGRRGITDEARAAGVLGFDAEDVVRATASVRSR
jgi:AAA+ ATPase superfamily predicted ATPase